MRKHLDKLYPVIAFLAVGICFFFMLHVSWLKWGDIIIDTGRELYLPKVLSEGRLLYRDIFYVYGPFSPYFNALLFKLFGASITTAAAGGIAMAAISTWLVFRLAGIWLGRGSALFVTVCYVLVVPFGNMLIVPIFNFALPYSYPAVHSLVFSLASLLFYRRYLEKGESRELNIALFMFFLALLTKVEVAVWLGAALYAGFVCEYAYGGEPLFRAALKSGKRMVWPVLGVLAIFLFTILMGAAEAYYAMMAAAGSNFTVGTKSSFAKGLLFGEPDAGKAIRYSILTTLHLALILGIAGYSGQLYDRLTADPVKNRLRHLAHIGAAASLMLVYMYFKIGKGDLYKPFTAVSVAALVISLMGWWRGSERRDRIFLASLSLFSILMLGRIFFNPTPGAFGFYLSVPAFILFAIFLFRIMPDIFGGGMAGKYIKIVSILMIGTMTYTSLDLTLYNYSMFDAPFETPKGTVTSPVDQRVKAYGQLTDFLMLPEYRNKTLVMFPEGLLINFITGLENPLYQYQFLPIDIRSPAAMSRLIKDFEAKKPDFFVLTDRDVEEYGAKDYLEYASQLKDYIEAHYRPVRSFGGRILLYQRN